MKIMFVGYSLWYNYILYHIEEVSASAPPPLATGQVTIGLDHGVIVNYQKFGAALKKIPGLDTKEE